MTMTSPAFDALLARYTAVRGRSLALAAPLSPEDCAAQSMPDASPTKWHLAHTTWFFEQFVLGPHDPGYQPFHPDYAFLFNSYYVSAGPRHIRAERGLLTRPGATAGRQPAGEYGRSLLVCGSTRTGLPT